MLAIVVVVLLFSWCLGGVDGYVSGRHCSKRKTSIVRMNNDDLNSNLVDPPQSRSVTPLIKLDKKRFLGYNLLAVGLAIGANFLGITSWLLSFNVDLFRTKLKADIVYPINSLSRYIDSDYEFLYPAKWIKDRNVFLLKTARNELPLALRQKKTDTNKMIDVAYLSIDSRLENLSLIKTKIEPEFVMEKNLGTPREAAVYLLDNIIAPKGSGKVYALLDAYDRAKNDQKYYVFEYTLQITNSNFFQHTLSVVTAHTGDLYTFTITIPEGKFDSYRNNVMDIVSSFEVTAL